MLTLCCQQPQAGLELQLYGPAIRLIRCLCETVIKLLFEKMWVITLDLRVIENAITNLPSQRFSGSCHTAGCGLLGQLRLVQYVGTVGAKSSVKGHAPPPLP